MRTFLLLALAFLLLFPGALLSGNGALAASSVTVVVLDVNASRQSPEDAAAAKSALGLLVAFEPSPRLAFMTYTAETSIWTPVSAGSPEARLAVNQIHAELGALSAQEGNNLAGALSEAFNLLSEEGALEGSSVYLISGGLPSPDPANQESQVRSLLGLYTERGWSINTVALPGISSEGVAFVETIARSTSGEAFEASFPDGLKALADHLFSYGQEGSLVSFLQGDLDRSELLTSSVRIAPRTQAATLVFFKEEPSAVLRLLGPSGNEASSADGAIASVTETPHAVIWKLTSPEPGEWQARIQGQGGRVLAWHHSVNTLQLFLESTGPFPLEDPTVITASIRDGGNPLALDDVRLFAYVTSPAGGAATHELNDRGEDGDRVAGDGYYSVRVPPLAQQGSYEVTLELVWPAYDSRASSQAQFRVEPFPQITIEPVQTEGLQIGEATRVANILINVRGEPYPITLEDLAPSAYSSDGTPVPIDIRAEQVFGEGRAWRYYAIFTPQEGGVYTLSLQLRVEYLGREYIYSAQPLSLPVPIPPPAPAVMEEGGFPAWTIAPVGIAVLLLISGVFWLVRTRPYGYIYDDKGRLVADLTHLRRNPLWGFLFRSSVRGWEIRLPGLEGVTFRFSRRGVRLSYRRKIPTVRVNNQPVVGRTALADRAWIGSQGRLYTFLMSPSAAGAAGNGDN